MVDKQGQLTGLVQLHDLHDVWKDASLLNMLKAEDIARKLPVLKSDEDLRAALKAMNRSDIDVLPVQDEVPNGPARMGLITRAAIRRHLSSHATLSGSSTGSHPVVPTEVEG